MSTDVRPGQSNPFQCHACGYPWAGGLRICPMCGADRMSLAAQPQPLPRTASGDMAQTLDHLATDEEGQG